MYASSEKEKKPRESSALAAAWLKVRGYGITNALHVMSHHDRVERLIERSGIGAGVGEKDRVLPSVSRSCS
jgi:hypothetical protein